MEDAPQNKIVFSWIEDGYCYWGCCELWLMLAYICKTG